MSVSSTLPTTGVNQELFDRYDKDKSGALDLRELAESGLKLPWHDTNGDGSMDLGECQAAVAVTNTTSVVMLRDGSAITGNIPGTLELTLPDGSRHTFDTSQIKNQKALDILQALMFGLPVTQADLDYLASDEGSENLFSGKDADVWNSLVQPVWGPNPDMNPSVDDRRG